MQHMQLSKAQVYRWISLNFGPGNQHKNHVRLTCFFHRSLSEVDHISHAAIRQCFFLKTIPFIDLVHIRHAEVSLRFNGVTRRVPCHDFSYETTMPSVVESRRIFAEPRMPAGGWVPVGVASQTPVGKQLGNR